MNADTVVSPRLPVAGVSLAASPAIAKDFVCPRPGGGRVVERTVYTVAYAEIWQTDKDGKDATGRPLRAGWVGAPPGGDFTAIDGGWSIFVRDEVRMFVPRNPKLPDVRQRITD